jgi:hypothetical protein
VIGDNLLRIDWAAAGAALVAVLALVASIFSAIAAARSADVAVAAESRRKVADRDQALREVRRTRAMIDTEAEVVRALIVECHTANQNLGRATSTPPPASVTSRAEALQDRLQELESLVGIFKVNQWLETTDEEIAARQIQFDDILIRTRGLKETIAREGEILRRERELTVLKDRSRVS